MTNDSPMTAGELADALVEFVAEQVSALAAHHAPGFVLPRVFAGHVVGPDTRSDLAYTLGLLFEAGIEKLASTRLDDVVIATLLGLDGAKTDTFYSYRAAESLQRLGGYHDNPRLAELGEDDLANLRLAFDSSASAVLVREGRLPRNYAVVVARCEYARQQLDLLDDTAILDELCERSLALITRASEGWIDDSNDERGQFDIYTADIFLFAEPIAGRLGDAWQRGLRRVLSDVDALALPGGAIVWGRSIGALGLAMTIELAAVGAARSLVENPTQWLARAAWTLAELRSWFGNGVIRAHQHRSTMFYRGPARRLQMTLDVLGKLVQAALELRRVSSLAVGNAAEAWRPVDRIVRFGAPGRNEAAGAWAYRSNSLSFVLPHVGGFSPDYLPVPRSPGTFESPVGRQISMVPVVHHRGKQLVAAGVPESVEHQPGMLVLEYAGFRELTAGPEPPMRIEGKRIVRYRIDGRSLVVEETLEFEADPSSFDAVALQVPALASRPLDVTFECTTPHQTNKIDVAGLAEFRSFWSELATVHQLDAEPAQKMELRWRVTPQLRVASTAHTHPYDDALYGPVESRLVRSPAPRGLASRPRKLRDTDVLHMHWPEWWQGPDLARNREAIKQLKDGGVRIVWTQHNLVPHRFRDDAGHELYAEWARAADAIIHHSELGREQTLAAYDYRPDAIHRVIPHGHWKARYAPHAATSRTRIEADLGLAPCAIRLGVVGAPRAEKDVQLVLDAFHACSRDDLQLVVTCVEGETIPDDPRICAIQASHVSEHVYYQRLVAIDALVLPFDEGMLMTGTAFDAIGAEKAAITSAWPILGEVLGEAAIPYGETREDLTRCLESLTRERLDASANAMRALQPATEWATIAEQTLDLFEQVTR